eukprot:jgi/Ulvmu1/9673/UM055_0011.1
MPQWTACVRVESVYHRVDIVFEREGERLLVNKTATEYQALIDKLLTIVYGTLGRFQARIVGADGPTVYVCTSSRDADAFCAATCTPLVLEDDIIRMAVTQSSPFLAALMTVPGP